MLPQENRIKTRMKVISADGGRMGYVERITEAEIITVLPCRHIPLTSIRCVTDDVYVAQRYSDTLAGENTDRQAVEDPNCGEISTAEGERLRQAIDSGRTHEKVAGSDPAVVPFETDAEAAGAPTSRQAVRSTLAKETKEPPQAWRKVIHADQNHNPFAFLYFPW